MNNRALSDYKDYLCVFHSTDGFAQSTLTELISLL